MLGCWEGLFATCIEIAPHSSVIVGVSCLQMYDVTGIAHVSINWDVDNSNWKTFPERIMLVD